MTDVIIIGTGATASVVANHFAGRGKKILMLERGLDKPYAPAMRAEHWHETTVEEPGRGRNLKYNRWTGMPTPGHEGPGNTTYDDLVMVENVHKDFAFDYNMRLGYGGSSAVWSGRTWRFFDEDFSTRSSFGYGLDWPVSAAEMQPFYDQAEALMGVSGPKDSDWPWGRNFTYPEFPATHQDKVMGELFSEEFNFYPTANAVKRKHPMEGGCVAAKSCVEFCPSNALYRHYQSLDALRANGSVTVEADRIVSSLDVDGDGRVRAIRFVSRENGTGRLDVEPHQKVFLCANTIENLRVLLNSGRVTGKPIANSSGKLGRYFASHGAVVREMTVSESLQIGRGRPSTSAGLTHDLSRDRSQVNAYMAELWNINFLRGSPHVALMRLRESTRKWGRNLIDEGKILGRKAPVSIIFELEMRERNRVDLSQVKDKWGIPAARVDLKLSDRDMATFNHVFDLFKRASAHPNCEGMAEYGHGVNGNHPMGGYNMGTNARTAVTDKSGRCFDHENLYVMGGGLFNSTSPFNPTLTITANTLRCLSLIRDG